MMDVVLGAAFEAAADKRLQFPAALLFAHESAVQKVEVHSSIPRMPFFWTAILLYHNSPIIGH